MLNSISNTVNKIVETDVAVIGGGAAGLWAAIRAKDKAERVVIVEKSKVARSGCASFLAGIMLVCFPEHDKETWLKEMVDYDHGCYLNDQEWARIYLDDSYQRAVELNEWADEYGIDVFEKSGNGEFIRRKSRGHVNTEHVLVKARPMMDTLKNKALEKGVRIFERIMAVDLVVHKGRAVGVIGFDYRTGDVYLFKAKSVVLSGGALGSKYIFLAKGNLSGDLVAAAFRAGATLQNMELTTSNLCAADFNTHGMNLYISVGGRFVNSKGEEFMRRYNPRLVNRAVLHDLAVAMSKEVMQGRGPIYLDITRASKEDQILCRKILPESFKIWDRARINPFKKKVKWVPAFHGHIGGADSGGVRINTKCETDIQGLYAAGDNAVRSAHGGLGGGAIGFAVVSGYRAGQHASEFSRKAKPSNWGDKELSEKVARLVKEMLAPVMRTKDVSPDKLIYAFQKTLIKCPVIYIRNETRLRKALADMKSLKKLSQKVEAPDLHELVKAIEARNMIEIAEIILEAALIRKESRIEHFREDYPQIDNIEWLKWINVKKTEDQIKFWTEEIETPYVKPPRERVEHSGAKGGT